MCAATSMMRCMSISQDTWSNIRCNSKSILSSPGDMLDIGKDKAAKEAVAITPGTANGAVQGVQVSSFVDIDLAACLILCKHQGCSKKYATAGILGRTQFSWLADGCCSYPLQVQTMAQSPQRTASWPQAPPCMFYIIVLARLDSHSDFWCGTLQGHLILFSCWSI